MRHLTAAQREDGTGWHYVSMNRRGGHPLGYCGEHAPHPTEAEARECYARYQRDNIVLNDGNWSWGNCHARDEAGRCKHPANKAATVRHDGYTLALLCPEHMTLEHATVALGLDGPAGDAWVS